MLLFFSLLLISFLSGVEVNIFTPSLPILQKKFALSLYETQFLVSINFLTFCIGCLMVGILGDKFSRRSVLLHGILIFILGSIMCATAYKYFALLLGRSMQGVGIAAPSILGFVVISDHYPYSRQKSLLGIYNSVVTISMSSASILGSYINYFFGWRMNFVLLSLIGILTLILCYFYIPNNNVDANVKFSLTAYHQLLKSKKILLLILSICLLVAPYWSFLSISPVLFIDTFKVDIRCFGIYQGCIALSFALMSAFSMQIATLVGTRRLMFICIGMYLSGIGIFSHMMCSITVNPDLIVLGMMLICAAAAYPLNNLYPLFLLTSGKNKSMAAALINGVRLLFTTCVINIISLFYNGNFLPLGASIIIMILAFLFMLLVFINKGWIN